MVYLGMIGKTREMYKEELRPAAEERLGKRLLLNEVSEREGLQVDPEEVEAEIDRMQEMMGPQADDMMEMLTSPEGRIMLANDLVSAKAQERVVAIAKGEAVDTNKPQHRGQAGNGEAVHQHRKHVLGAHQAAIEQRQARQGHEEDQRRGRQNPGRVGTVNLRLGGHGGPC